jgi:hypothetical protein
MSDIDTSGVATTGYNTKTLNHLLLDAGALYKNFGLADQALIGATSGGNEFDAKAKVRQIKADGVKAENAKGLEVIDSVSTALKCKFLEITEDILKASLIADVDTATDSNYDILTGKTKIEDSDYIKNIAWVGTISGSGKPVIIIIYNALCLDGLQLKAEDSKDNTLDITFTGHADPTTPQALPYKIYYPKLTDMVAFNLVSAAVSGSKVVLTMSDTVAETVPFDGFNIKVAGNADVITAATRGTVNTKTIELTVTTAPTTGQAVTVGYAKPTDASKQVQSTSGVALDNIATTSVKNS